MFITFEGIEGSGKTTQIQLVADRFRQQGREVVITKEPGGTAFGVMIRELILNPAQHFSSVYTELLLFYADRLEHVASVIRPALEKGQVVICDRYVDSTYAYQVAARGMPADLVDRLNQCVELMPGRTILLDLPVEEGLKRAKARAELDRFEQEDLRFHEAVRQGYLSLAQREPERFSVVDVLGKSVDVVFGEVWGVCQ